MTEKGQTIAIKCSYSILQETQQQNRTVWRESQMHYLYLKYV